MKLTFKDKKELIEFCRNNLNTDEKKIHKTKANKEG